MEDLYLPVKQQKKNDGFLHYCADCFNNPISWIIAPTLIGYASILTGAMQTGEEVRQAFSGSHTYQDAFYYAGRTIVEKIFTPESFAGLTGFLFGGKIWRFIRGKK